MVLYQNWSHSFAPLSKIVASANNRKIFFFFFVCFILNDISSYTTKPISTNLDRNFSHMTHYQILSNSSALLSKMIIEEIFKRHLPLGQWSAFKVISQKYSSYAPQPILLKGSAPLTLELNSLNEISSFITKTKIPPPKTENFEIKNFYISAQNIGSNEYPHSMFLSRYKKNNV